jgi:hypothetical protein
VLSPPFSSSALLALSLLLSPSAFASDPAPTRPRYPGVPEPPLTEMHAWAGYAQSMGELARLIAWTEIAFPDLRLQTSARVDSVDALVFSWPVHLGGIRKGRKASAGGTLFVEPAFPTNHLAARGLGGVRVWGATQFGLVLVLEGGGVAATDGHGAFAGGGAGIGDPTGLMVLVVRRYFILGDDRWDFAIDIRPTTTLADLLGG